MDRLEREERVEHDHRDGKRFEDDEVWCWFGLKLRSLGLMNLLLSKDGPERGSPAAVLQRPKVAIVIGFS